MIVVSGIGIVVHVGIRGVFVWLIFLIRRGRRRIIIIVNGSHDLREKIRGV